MMTAPLWTTLLERVFVGTPIGRAQMLGMAISFASAAYLVLVAGVCSQVLYAYGLRDVTASQAMAFTYLMPVFTAFFAAIFLDEEITPATVVCGAAIVFGLWLVNSRRSKPGAATGRASTRSGEETPRATAVD